MNVKVNNCSRNISVFLDETWQKRANKSLNNVVCAASRDTDKIIDVNIVSKYFHCFKKVQNTHEDNFIAGSSGAMEVAGAKNIFGKSRLLHNVRYI